MYINASTASSVLGGITHHRRLKYIICQLFVCLSGNDYRKLDIRFAGTVLMEQICIEIVRLIRVDR